ncbi:MAG: histidine-type phosphatase [Bacillota bacterium]
MKTRINSLIFIVLIIFSVSTFAQDTLVYSVALVRHADRTPWSDAAFKNVNYKWPFALGELTPRGMQQEYQLGREFRQKYVDKYHLLTENYIPGSIYALSTEMNRTVMSADCLLAGFYPPGTGPKLADGQPALPDQMQVIPVFTITGGQKNFICPELENPDTVKILIYATLGQPMFLDEQKKYAADLKRWGAIMGADFPDMRTLLGASDYINCMLTNNAPLPKGLTKSDAEKMVNAGFVNQAELYSTDGVTRYMASDFMKRLNGELNRAAQGKQTNKLALYLGHDTSVLAVMSAIRSPLPNNPPYAAHVEFDLFKNDAGQYYMTATYNGVAVKFANTGKDSCTLEQFAALTSPYTAQ